MGCEHCLWIDREFTCFKPEDETCPEKEPFIPEEENQEEVEEENQEEENQEEVEIEITVDDDFEIPF